MIDPQANLPECGMTAQDGAVPCDLCALNHLCEPLDELADPADRERGPVGGRQIKLKRGDVLFRKGDNFSSVYAVSRGSIKLAIPKDADDEQVMGFRVAGELVGVNGIGAGEYLSDAVALEDTEVCELELHFLDETRNEMVDMDRRMLKVLGADLVCDQYEVMLLGKKSADERLAAFILGLAERYRHHGFSDADFSFAMTRGDLANYLGLAKETVSRLFIRFRDQKLIANRKRRIQLLDVPALRKLAEMPA